MYNHTVSVEMLFVLTIQGAMPAPEEVIIMIVRNLHEQIAIVVLTLHVRILNGYLRFRL